MIFFSINTGRGQGRVHICSDGGYQTAVFNHRAAALFARPAEAEAICHTLQEIGLSPSFKQRQ